MGFLASFHAGHLRAIITIIFTIAFTVGFFLGTVNADVFTAASMMSLGFYFSNKSNSETPEIRALNTDSVKK